MLNSHRIRIPGRVSVVVVFVVVVVVFCCCCCCYYYLRLLQYHLCNPAHKVGLFIKYDFTNCDLINIGATSGALIIDNINL